MNPPSHPAVVLLLEPVARLYAAAVGLRNRFYDQPARAHAVGAPVISVGNLTVGGTGKTPMVAWLARELERRGRRPAVISRGYGGKAGRGPLLVSDGGGPRVDASVAGDEPTELATAHPGLIVVVGSDRVAGARAAIKAGADVLLLDDGFQHRRLARDLDLVLLEAHDPFGNYRTLPSGRLREPLRGLRRADLVLLTRAEVDETFPLIERVVRVHHASVPIVRCGHRIVDWLRDGNQPVAPPVRAVAFCGIGNPERFRLDLQRAGVELLGFHSVGDHRRFRHEELSAWAAEAARHEVPLITTAKDDARLGAARQALGATALVVVRIEACVHDPEPLRQALDTCLRHATESRR